MSFLLHGVELVTGNDGDVLFLQEVDSLIGAVEAEDQDGVVAGLLDHGVHIFHIDTKIGRASCRERVSSPV